uniref:CSON001412 protein n=1 Tax=Culicoides sonorensis TaxID=179676 RepID=A0A336LQU8_CULSO
MKNSWKLYQIYTQKYWKRWVKEYLPELTCRTKWHCAVDPLKVDDIIKLNSDFTNENLPELCSSNIGLRAFLLLFCTFGTALIPFLGSFPATPRNRLPNLCSSNIGLRAFLLLFCTFGTALIPFQYLQYN